MNGFRRWFSQYMIGRYGSDELNRFMLIIAAILVLLGLFFPIRKVNFIVVLILVVCYVRMFSRNIPKRQQENLKFLQLKDNLFGKRKGGAGGYGRAAGSSAAGGFTSKTTAFKSKDDGKRILICPFCGEKLKVPVGAGKIRVRCPHCKQEFEERV